MLAGMMARPRAISSRTNSGVMNAGSDAPKLSPCASLRFGAFEHFFAAEILPRGDEDHLLSDHAGAGELILRDVRVGAAAARRRDRRATRHQPVFADIAVVFRPQGPAGIGFETAAGKPRVTQAR